MRTAPSLPVHPGALKPHEIAVPFANQHKGTGEREVVAGGQDAACQMTPMLAKTSTLLGQAAEGSLFVLEHHSWHLMWEWRGNWGWSPVLLWGSAGNVTLGRAHFVSASCSSPVWVGLCKNGYGRIQEAADTFEMYRVNCSAAFRIVCAFQPCRSHQCLLSITGLCLCVFICGFGLMVCAKAAHLGALSLLIALATLTSNLQ